MQFHEQYKEVDFCDPNSDESMDGLIEGVKACRTPAQPSVDESAGEYQFVHHLPSPDIGQASRSLILSIFMKCSWTIVILFVRRSTHLIGSFKLNKNNIARIGKLPTPRSCSPRSGISVQVTMWAMFPRISKAGNV